MKNSKEYPLMASKTHLAIGAAALLIAPQAFGAPGDVDPEFGTNGYVEFEMTAGNTEIWGELAVLPNGQILVSGTVDNRGVVAKLTSTGDPITDFGDNGLISVNFGGITRINSMTTTMDGRIILTGKASFYENSTWQSKAVVARYLPNGLLDLDFGGVGMVELDIPGSDTVGVSHVLTTEDGKILISGNSGGRCLLVRLTGSGFLDASFSNGGLALFDFAWQQHEYITQSLIQPDGKIISVGSAGGRILAFRMNEDGTLDPTFANGWGLILPIQDDNDFASSLLIRPGGGIFLAGGTGWLNMNSVVVALNDDGTLDESFAEGGILEIDMGGADRIHAATIMPDGRVIAAGKSSTTPYGENNQYTLLRLMPDGSPDSLFGTNGVLHLPQTLTNGSATALARDRLGGILVMGRTYTVERAFGGTLIRLIGDPDSDGDGIPDSSETGTGIYVSPFDTGTDPHNPDTDGDGLSDGDEVFKYFTDPLNPDTDGDGFLDGYEVMTGKNPLDPNDKPALVAEVRTSIEFSFPSAIGKTYRIEASTNLSEWTPIEENITGTGAAIIRFYTTRNQPKRFLRVEEQTAP